MKGYLEKNFFVNYFLKYGRSFPWRETGNPYHILIAELMLRQTRAETVAPIWQTFISHFPTSKSILTSSKESIIQIIRPLGLYNQRYKAILEVCEYIESKHNGKIPESQDLLLKVPHIGLYSVNAILCFAFSKRAPIVDTNIIRVINRLTGSEEPFDNRRAPFVWEYADNLLPNQFFKEHNYGLLDFSAKICKSPIPECVNCPIYRSCNYYRYYFENQIDN